MSVYRVTSRVPYQGYRQGQEFETTLPAAVEERALARGSIEIVERSTPALVPGSYTLAADAAEGGADAHTDTAESRRRHRS